MESHAWKWNGGLAEGWQGTLGPRMGALGPPLPSHASPSPGLRCCRSRRPAGHRRAAVALPDRTPSASQLSRRRSAAGAGRGGLRRGPRGSRCFARRPPLCKRSLCRRLCPAAPRLPRSADLERRTRRARRGAAVGRRGRRRAERWGRPRTDPPLPARPSPPLGGARGGRGGRPRVSLGLRHRPRSWRRRSGRYPGPGRRGVWGTRPRRALSLPSPRPELGARSARGFGPSVGLVASLRTQRRPGWSGAGGGRPGSAPARACGEGRRVSPGLRSRLSGRRNPQPSPCPAREPASPGLGRRGRLGAPWGRPGPGRLDLGRTPVGRG